MLVHHLTEASTRAAAIHPSPPPTGRVAGRDASRATPSNSAPPTPCARERPDVAPVTAWQAAARKPAHRPAALARCRPPDGSRTPGTSTPLIDGESVRTRDSHLTARAPAHHAACAARPPPRPGFIPSRETSPSRMYMCISAWAGPRGRRPRSQCGKQSSLSWGRWTLGWCHHGHHMDRWERESSKES